jgi:exopolysaccharide biosynthesis polyprenyl glycosylphosphotransferase
VATRPGWLVALVVPVADALALLAVLAVAGRLDIVGAVAGVALLVLLNSARSPRTRLNPRVGDDLPGLLGRMAVGLVLATMAVLAFGDRDQAFELLTRVAPAAALLVPVGRAVAYALIRRARARRQVVEPTLVVGAGQIGAQLAKTLAEHPEYGLAPVGFLDDHDRDGLAMPVLGDVDALVPVIQRNRITRVVVAYGGLREPKLISMLRACDRLPIEFYVVPRFFELGVAPGEATDDVWGIPLVWLRRPALRGAARNAKRLADVLLAGVALVLAEPLLAACAAAVRLSSPGPVLLRQRRLGQDGQPFEVLKFRTMLPNPDSDTTWSVAHDQRQTGVGRVLRRTGLDELPQLLNVLRGDMSIVGPRPERPHFVRRFVLEVPRYDHRHRMPSGITGWAQVHGLRGDTPIPDRVRFDNHYIEHWSLWRDLVIIVRTVGQVVRGGHH